MRAVLQTSTREKQGRSIAGMIQPKLSVSEPGDRYEQEADRMADQVISRQEEDREEEKPVQKKEDSGCFLSQTDTPAINPQFSGTNGRNLDNLSWVQKQLVNSRGNGNQLPDPARSSMEKRFGADFSSVRIHTGVPAERMNDEIHAHAFTTGRDIYFNRGRFDPESIAGRHLLAHELTHTIQQGVSHAVQPMLIQRDYAVEPTVEHPELEELSGSDVDKAIKYNRVLFTDAAEIGIVRDVLGLSPEPAEVNEDFVSAVAEYQAGFGLEQDGMLGPVTSGRLSAEITREADGLTNPEEQAPLRRVARRLELRSMISTSRRGSIMHVGFVGPDENPTAAVTVRAGDRTSGVSNLISLEYTGENANRVNWLQFINMQMFATPPGAAARVYNTGSVGTTGGNVDWSDATTTHWFVDADPANPSPLYNDSGLAIRNAGRRITMFDQPGGASGLPVAQTFAATTTPASTQVTLRMNFDSYAILNNRAVYHVRWSAITVYDITAGTSGEIEYRQGSAGNVSGLSGTHRTALTAEYAGSTIR